jgi:hypothetical protein
MQTYVGDVIDIDGTANDFQMTAPSDMLQRLDGSEGISSVGLNTFRLLKTGTIQITYKGGSMTLSVSSAVQK